MRRAERVTVQGPIKEQQPDGMSHGGMMVGSCRHLQQPLERHVSITKKRITTSPLLKRESQRDHLSLFTREKLVKEGLGIQQESVGW